MSLAEFWIVAGINGAGKTTFAQKAPIRSLLQDVEVLNADDVTLRLLRDDGIPEFAAAPPDKLLATFREAADHTERLIRWSIASQRSVGVETVLSTSKYKEILLDAQSAGYFVGMIYVALRSPDLAVARVADRVARGGHDVPADRIRERWQRSLDNLGWFAARVDRLFVFDNSDDHPDHPARLIAEAGDGVIVLHDPDAVPDVTRSLLAAGATRTP